MRGKGRKMMNRSASHVSGSLILRINLILCRLGNPALETVYMGGHDG